jgi:hypothetical protein
VDDPFARLLLVLSWIPHSRLTLDYVHHLITRWQVAPFRYR